MAIEQEDDGGGVPEWVVTFGDMMSLLLTFFIMLVSLSEIKEEERYQAMVESIRQQFGYDSSPVSMAPGALKPRNSTLAKLASAGRARKLDTKNGGDKVQAPTGDFPRVMIVRPGSQASVGAVLYFEEGTVRITDEQRAVLRQEMEVIGGKPQKIEIRGHTTQQPVDPQSGYPDHWAVAYQRCRNVMRVLVDEMGVDPKRIRLSVAGPSEPVYLGTDPDKLRNNPRVEIYLLDEVIEDFQGDAQQRAERYEDEDADTDGSAATLVPSHDF